MGGREEDGVARLPSRTGVVALLVCDTFEFLVDLSNLARSGINEHFRVVEWLYPLEELTTGRYVHRRAAVHGRDGWMLSHRFLPMR